MSDMTRFAPHINERSPSGSWFAEIFTFPGPVEVADIGNGTQRERFGWNWLTLLTPELEVQMWQERPAGSGNWEQVTSPLLPPVIGTTLPPGSRRLSAVFDQSGRVALAYEHEGLVRVTRWDVELQEYVQNVAFPGVNPTLATDLHAGIPVADSDVWIFYQPPEDLSQVYSRIQRDLYLTVYTVWDGDVELILDRAQVGVQLQLLVSDARGNPLRDETGQLVVLAGPYFPWFVEDRVRLDAVPTTAIYEETTLVRDVEDAVQLDATVINPDGLSGEPVRQDTRRSPAGYAPDGACTPINPPNAGLQAWELLDTSLTACLPIWSAFSYGNSPSCTMVPMPGRMQEWGAGDSDDHGFDVILASQDMQERYGVAGAMVNLRVMWSIIRKPSSESAYNWLDPVPNYDGVHEDLPQCIITHHWQAGDRTIVVEMAQSSTENAADAFEWVEVHRFTDGPPFDMGGSPSLEPFEIREYGFALELDNPFLTTPAYPHVLMRVRTLPGKSVNGNQNSTSVHLLGGTSAQFNILGNAYVSNVLQRSVQDTVVFDALPTTAVYADNTEQLWVEDHVQFNAAPAVAQHVLQQVARPQTDDPVIFTAVPTTAASRRVNP